MSHAIKNPDRYKTQALRMFAKVASWMDDKEFDAYVRRVQMNRITQRVYAGAIVEQVNIGSRLLKLFRKSA